MSATNAHPLVPLNLPTNARLFRQNYSWTFGRELRLGEIFDYYALLQFYAALESGKGRRVTSSITRFQFDSLGVVSPIQEEFLEGDGGIPRHAVHFLGPWRIVTAIRNAVNGLARDAAFRIPQELFEKWEKDEGAFQWEGRAFDDTGRTVVNFHVDIEETGEHRLLTLHAKTYNDLFVPGNNMRWLAAHGIDPTRYLYQRLANGRLLLISWWEVISVPRDPISKPIELEIHSRTYDYTPQLVFPQIGRHTVFGMFFDLHAPTPINFTVPVLAGGWCILWHHRSAIVPAGALRRPGTVLIRSSPENILSYVETVVREPIVIPPNRNVSIIWRVVCVHCFHQNAAATHNPCVHHAHQAPS
ncbi:hypothetical protein BD626DRAFT_575775 [Schizophyllum amplum]|uniref:Uncharacterized protein n=1 Tax=Schizophyllum amplum TaxID=97359 RepID=A0A550BV08_9AGAR|nr:hypothetical protein BD626DRAFT_575775 [Auriculariopsis ampla]